MRYCTQKLFTTNDTQEKFSFDELISKLKLKEKIESLKEQRAKESEEEDPNKTLKRLEELRQREGELFERLDQLKSKQQVIVPKLIELLVPRPIQPQPLLPQTPLLSTAEERRKIPA
jgi:hypothetical protein